MKQHCGVHGSDPIPGTGVPSLGGVVWTLQRHAQVRHVSKSQETVWRLVSDTNSLLGVRAMLLGHVSQGDSWLQNPVSTGVTCI